MAKKISITIEASEEHPDVLTVQDALQQAIDHFEMLTDDSNKNVVWNLTLASTNSPFTCEGEPIDLRTMAGAHAVVQERIAVVQRNLQRVADGKEFDESFPRDKLEVARRFLKRNTNGIGKTTVTLSEDDRPIAITQSVAKAYFEDVMEPAQSLHSYLFQRTSRREVGSIEGRIIDIGTDYDSPAIHVEEHKSGRQFWCRIGGATEEQLADEIKAGDAWKHRRVRVRGTLNYDNAGKVIRVVDGSVAFIDVGTVDLDKVADRGFTGGYSVSEYLDRLQENEFGQQ